MDASGARILHARIAERQWRSAPSVSDGRQPSVDPDAAELELVDGDVRVYRSEAVSAMVDGRPSTVHRHLTKRLVDGAWESAYEIEHAEPADAPAALASRSVLA